MAADIAKQPSTAAVTTEKHLWTNFNLMEVFDQFAQFVCNRYPFNSQARKNGPTHTLSGISVPVSPERPNITLTIDVLNETDAVVRPFPFDVNPLRLSFEGRLVPNRRFADQEEFLQQFYSGERIAINYTPERGLNDQIQRRIATSESANRRQQQKSRRLMSTTEKIIDSDAHVFEPHDIWLRYLDPSLRDIVFRTPGLENGNSTGNDGPISRFPLGFIPETGRQDLLQLAADSETRLKVMDDEGIDRVALFPTHALRLGGVRQPQLAPALFRAYNDWLAEHCAPDKERLLGVAMIPLQEPELAVQRSKARRR